MMQKYLRFTPIGLVLMVITGLTAGAGSAFAAGKPLKVYILAMVELEK